jgi:uncharacterized protein
MKRIIYGFDWDTSNIEKCQKHGVATTEIEFLFEHKPSVFPDIKHSDTETRYFAIGINEIGRYIFLVFTYRVKNKENFIRPISARYMHKKEINNYINYEKNK